MQLYISHRGSVSGPNPKLENTLSYLSDAINLGYHVETDVWVIGEDFYLGHDEPEHYITLYDLEQLAPKSIFHAKNDQSLQYFTTTDFHYFSHEKDSVVLTSKQWLWYYPGVNPVLKPNNKAIAVMPESAKAFDISHFYGICTDKILHYKRLYE